MIEVQDKRLGQAWCNVSLSTGTLRTEDLLSTFLSFIEEYAPKAYQTLQDSWRDDILNSDGGGLFWGEDFSDWLENEPENADFLLDETFDILESIAPDGCTFSSHPGDGADFGFWSVEEE